MQATPGPQLNPLLKLVLDLGPLVLFFLANSRYGIFAATGTFMAAVVAALAVSYVMTRHLPIMPVVTAIHQGQADDHLCAVRRRAARRPLF